MKLLITLCFVIGLCSGAFGLKSDVFAQATCPAVQDKIDQVEQSYNGLFLSLRLIKRYHMQWFKDES